MRGAKKAYSSEVFDSIIAEFKENIQFKEKISKNLEARKIKKENQTADRSPGISLKNLVV